MNATSMNPTSMNATSLYTSISRTILLANPADKSSWSNLYCLVPYLRQSLSCTVCGNLLKEPYSPESCQHHVCYLCIGEEKKLFPPCKTCKDEKDYAENTILNTLVICYRKICNYFLNTETFKAIVEEDVREEGQNGSSSLLYMIREAANLDDDYKCNVYADFVRPTKSAYSIYKSASTQTQVSSPSTSTETRERYSNIDSPNNSDFSNGSSLYSVMCAGSGNKITIKRKAIDETEIKQSETSSQNDKVSQLAFKKPSNRSRNLSSKRKGCRCGNATPTPGKLTCCGQRCPCYVESKPCIECKCKGCRNPHRADGMKVRPNIPQLDSLQLSLNMNPNSSLSCSGSIDSLNSDSITMEAVEESLTFSTDYKSSHIKGFSSQIQEVSASLPATILMDDELSGSPDNLSSSCEFPQYSPQGTNDTELSSHSTDAQDIMTNIEIDV